MKIMQVFLFLLLALFMSCHINDDGKNKKASKHDFRNDPVSNPEIATGFRVKEDDGIKLIEITNPREEAEIRQKFYLVDRAHADLKFEDGETIIVPVQKMVCLSASHLSFLDALDEIDQLVGVSSADYVVSEKFKGLVATGKIKEIGIGDHFMLEALINLAPDVIMVSPQKGQSFSPLLNAGLTIVPNGDFLESDPLGRAEWIKLFGVLTGKETEAAIIFDSISAAYNELKKLTTDINIRPTVITGKQYGGFWNLAGGKSYEAKFLKDAGANYLWADDEGTGGIMLDFETVYNRGLNAEFWRFIVYSQNGFTYEMLKNEDGRYADFSAFKNKKVIVCNTFTKPFFQKGFLEPQVILADYIHIFHPELLPDHENVYYELLK